jgi:hypothetical protein
MVTAMSRRIRVLPRRVPTRIPGRAGVALVLGGLVAGCVPEQPSDPLPTGGPTGQVVEEPATGPTATGSVGTGSAGTGPVATGSAGTGPAATGPAGTGPSGTGSAPPVPRLVRVTSNPPDDPGQLAVFNDYATFWQRDMIALITNDLQRAGVLDYLTGGQAASTTAYISDRRKRHVRTLGLLTIAPTVLSATDQAAQIRDCLDQSGMFDIDNKGRKTQLPARVPMSVALIHTPDGRWRVSQLTPTADPSCR